MSKRIITLGTWDDMPIEWIVLLEENSAFFCVSKAVVFNHCFNDNENKGSAYNTSDIRAYLNNDFWNGAFNNTEKKRIINTILVDSNNAKDNVFLVSKSEVESLMTSEEAICGAWWYTRTPKTKKSVYDHRSDQHSFGEYLTDSDGIRPAIWVRKD